MRVVALLHRSSDLAAARLAARLGDATVVACAPDSEPLKQLLAGAGARRAIRLWDEALDGIDYLGVALALAGAVRALGEIDLIVCGDGGSGAVGPALAERLGWPHLGRVRDAWLEGDRLFARRQEGHALCKLAATPPALLCVAQEPAEAAPTPTEIEIWTLADAKLTAAELSYRRNFRPKPGPGLQAPKMVPRPVADVPSLIARLRDDGLLR